MDLQESHLTLPTITVCLDDSELSQLSAKPYGPFLCLRQVSQTIVRWKICFGGGAAPKQWEWGKKGICKESPKKGRSGGGEGEVGGGGEGGATSGRDALFQLHLLLRRGKRRLRSRRPTTKEGNAVLCKLS